MATAPHGFLRVAAACPPVRVADPERNADATLDVVLRARERGVQVLVLPELGLTGYTCGDLFFSLSTLVSGAERALDRVRRETSRLPIVLVVGLPVEQEGRLFNAAVVLQAGRVLGVVPKTYLPGYAEYYEERWFSSSREGRESETVLAGEAAPFGTDLLFQVPEEPGVTLAVEICEDLWAPIPPSSYHAVAGATVLLNPSASPDQVAKAEYRRELVRQQSGRALAAYVYANAGVHESTTDLVFGGHLMVAENGVLLSEGERFRRDGDLILADVDTERLRVERTRQTSFADAVHAAEADYRVVSLEPIPAPSPHRLARVIDPHPFVPSDPKTLDARCREVFSIQTAGLARRLEHVGSKR
ncbi:MAG: nitrilase-related carbon-nitrogen hydrolase, partial [Acidobacteriota bacterium]